MDQIHIWQGGVKSSLLEQAVPEFPKAEIARRKANHLFGRDKLRPRAEIRHGIIASEDSLSRIRRMPLVGHVRVSQIKSRIILRALVDLHPDTGASSDPRNGLAIVATRF